MSLHRFLKEHAMAKAKGVQGDRVIAGRAHQPEVEFLDSEQVRQTIYADVGVGLDVQLPESAPRPGNGHYIYVPGYTAQGPVCVTWGRKQQMTWAWLDKYQDEAYAIFDAKNTFKETVIDEATLNAFVARIPADC
jgi:hypothetical protein